MIDYSEMLSRIEYLNGMYEDEKDGIRAQMIAKLAAIEVGGWIEEFFDASLIHCIAKEKPECLDEIKEELKRVYSFNYPDLRKMIIKIIGIGRMYEVEKSNPRQVEMLKSALGKIKNERDKAAHTSVSISTVLAAPSVLKHEFVYAFENAVRLFEVI